MKVKELNELLAQCGPDEEVAFSMISGCCSDTEDLLIEYAEVMNYTHPVDSTKNYLRIIFYPLPGYESCMQAGRTISDHEEYWKNRNPATLEKIKDRKGK